MNLARKVTRGIIGWPVASQQVARRNALVASTVLADRRRERYEVEEFLAAHLAGRAAGDEPGHEFGQVRVEIRLGVG